MDCNNLSWDADSYNITNTVQYREAKELVDLIIQDREDNKKTVIEFVVDLGCGTGNVTNMISRRLSPKKLFACDVEAQMVEFANKANQDENIVYFVQNISHPWDLLDDKLKNLEGQVDVVFSNQVLHWLSDKATAVQTIARLLKPGGKCYSHFIIFRDLNVFASEEERKEQGKYFNIPTHKGQIELWNSLFKNVGLSQASVEITEQQWTYESIEQKKIALKAGFFVKAMTNENYELLSEEEKTAWITKMSAKYLMSMETPYGKDPKHHDDGGNNLNFYYERVRVVVTK